MATTASATHPSSPPALFAPIRPRRGARLSAFYPSLSGSGSDSNSDSDSSAGSSNGAEARTGAGGEGAPSTTPISLSDIDSAFQLQEYISLLIRQDPHDVERIVTPPGRGAIGVGKMVGEDGMGEEKDRDIEGKNANASEVVVDEACWVYEHLRRLAQDLTHPLITSLQQECTRASCPEMKAGEWLYLCVAHGNEGAMEQCCAIDYIIHTLDSATALLNSPKFFPSRLSIPPASIRHFSSLARRLGRIFAHAYFHHREAFEAAEAENALYARFLALTSRFELVPAEFLVIPPRLGAEGLGMGRGREKGAAMQKEAEMEPEPPRLLGAALHPAPMPGRMAQSLALHSPIDPRSQSPNSGNGERQPIWSPGAGVGAGSSADSTSPSDASAGAQESQSPRRQGRLRTDTMVFSDAAALSEELSRMAAVSSSASGTGTSTSSGLDSRSGLENHSHVDNGDVGDVGDVGDGASSAGSVHGEVSRGGPDFAACLMFDGEAEGGGAGEGRDGDGDKDENESHEIEGGIPPVDTLQVVAESRERCPAPPGAYGELLERGSVTPFEGGEVIEHEREHERKESTCSREGDAGSATTGLKLSSNSSSSSLAGAPENKPYTLTFSASGTMKTALPIGVVPQQPQLGFAGSGSGLGGGHGLGTGISAAMQAHAPAPTQSQTLVRGQGMRFPPASDPGASAGEGVVGAPAAAVAEEDSELTELMERKHVLEVTAGAGAPTAGEDKDVPSASDLGHRIDVATGPSADRAGPYFSDGQLVIPVFSSWEDEVASERARRVQQSRRVVEDEVNEEARDLAHHGLEGEEDREEEDEEDEEGVGNIDFSAADVTLEADLEDVEHVLRG